MGEYNSRGPFKKLVGRMAELDYTQEKLALELNLSQTTLSRKLNGLSQFTYDEMVKLIEVLDIKDEQISEYFFSDIIRKRIA